MSWHRQPFIRVVLGALGGAALIATGGGPEVSGAAGVVAAVATLFVATRHRREALALIALGLAISLVASTFRGRQDTRWHPWVIQIGETRSEFEFEGQITKPARVIRDRWYASVRVSRVDELDVPAVTLGVSGSLPAPENGEYIRAFARVMRPPPRDFPGTNDLRRRRELARAPLRADVVDWESMGSEGTVFGALEEALAERRRALQRRLVDALGEERGGIAIALTTGEKAFISPTLNQAFADTGTGHVLAISGLHFGVIGGAVWWCALLLIRRFRWMLVYVGDRRAAGVAVALTLALFLLFVGAPVSAVRAWIGASFVIGSLVLARPFCPFHALGWAALVLVIHDVSIVGDLGFQLSFAATLGILLFMRAPPRWLRRPEFSEDDVWSRRFRGLGLSIGVSTAATLLTTPIILAHFGIISIASFWTNLIVVPLVSIALFPGLLLGVVLDSIGVPGSVWLMRMSMNGFLVLGNALGDIARWPGSVVTPGACAPGTAGILMTVAAGLILVRNVRALITLGGASLVIVLCVGSGHSSDKGLEVHAIPVGQGDSLLVIESGRRVLIDAGGRLHGPDPGRRIVVPYLRRLGIDELDAFVVTHDDLDHSGGAAAVMDVMKVKRLITHATDSRAAHLARERNVPVVATASQSVALGGLSFASMPCESDNDQSVVTRVGRELLLTGDIERCGEDAFVKKFELGTRVVLAPHHGSSTSSSPSLVAATRPELVLVSSGRHNRFGHPRAEILERWRRVAPVFGTAQRGLIRLKFSPEVVEVRTLR